MLLSEQQRLALEWLMGGGSIAEAAQYAGVVRQTVSRWLHDDAEFRALFDHWQKQIRAITQARLVGLSESALETVADAIRGKRDAKVALVVLKAMGLLSPLPGPTLEHQD